MNKKQIRALWKKTWHFIWEEDSLASWIVNIILAFVLIKFLIYPGMGLVMATSHPVVAVVSGSMEHKTVHPCISNGYSYVNGKFQCVLRDDNVYEICKKEFSTKQRVDHEFFWQNCGSFYESKGISSDDFRQFDFSRGFNTGDIIILRGIKPEKIEIGDVIVFQATQPYPIIHRVVEKRYENNKMIFSTRGDHNGIQTPDDIDIDENSIIGKAIIRVPYLGWIKIGFFKLLDITGILKLANYIKTAF